MEARPPRLLLPGEPAPWFVCRSTSRERFVFDTTGGRYIVLCFYGSAGDARSAGLLQRVQARRERFDDVNLCFFGVSTDPDDERLARVAPLLPGIRHFWDADRAVSTRYRADDGAGNFRPVTYIIDPMLRVVATIEHAEAPDPAAQLFELLERLPRIAPPYLAPLQAPVLVLPEVFEAGLCQALVAHYDAQGGEDSGFMRDIDGTTTRVVEHGFKRRRDAVIRDAALIQACSARIRDRLVPQIAKAFQFHATHIERHIVSCYDAEEGGHFAPHRDNTTRGTAHRRFAVSLFLNTGQYDGGLLRFPEFGSALYAAPAGGAVVFACSLLHQATRVTRGRRFMYLPFLHDHAAQGVREANLRFVDPALTGNPPASGADDTAA